MKNLKQLTEAEWEKYTDQVAKKLAKSKYGRFMNCEFEHPKVEEFCGMFWEGDERSRWFSDIKKKRKKILKEKNAASKKVINYSI